MGNCTFTFLDLNMDGNLEFIVDTAGGTMRNTFSQAYYYSGGKLIKAGGGENTDAGEGYNSLYGMDYYYNKSTGKYMILCSNYFHAYYGSKGAYGTGGNFELIFGGKNIYVKYYSAHNVTNGVNSYYNGAKGYGNTSGYSKISKSTYDSINKNKTKNYVNANMKSVTIDLNNWHKWSTSTKKAKLTEAYDGFSVSKTVVPTPNLNKFEGRPEGVKLYWKAVSGAKNYRIFQKNGSSWKAIGNTTSTTFTDKTIKPNEAKTYTVRCTSANGKYFTSSFNSKGHNFKYASTPTLKSAAYVKGGVKITWNKPSGGVRYRVFYKNGSSWKSLGDTTATSFTHTNGTIGKNYTYTVRCVSSTGKNYTSYFNSKGITKTFKK